MGFWAKVFSLVILGAIGWATTFITMGYKAQADIDDLKESFVDIRKENITIKTELSAVKAITERTEKNTEEIRHFLLKKVDK
jgi:hypothetical protein